MKGLICFCLIFFVFCSAQNLQPIPYAFVPKGYEALLFARTNGRVRGIKAASNGDLLAVVSGRLEVFWWEGGNVRNSVLSEASGLSDKLFIDEQDKFV